MGACYSVNLKVDIVDEQGAIKALKNHIFNDKGVNYNIEQYAKANITTDTFDDLMKILLAELQREVLVWQVGEFRCYENDFDASYGWEDVMMEWFEILTPFIGEGSQLTIYLDEDYDELVVRNGKCVQIH